jgi:hypothetical protein
MFILDLGIIVNFRHKKKKTMKQRIQSTPSYLIASDNFMNGKKKGGKKLENHQHQNREYIYFHQFL